MRDNMIDHKKASQLLKYATELEAKGDIKKAIQELEKAVYMDPNDGNISNHLGDLYIKMNDKAGALIYFKKAIDAFKKDDYLRNSLAVCKKVLRYDPDNTEVYPVMGELLIKLDAKSDAIGYLFEYVEKQKEKADFEKVLETLDYIRKLGVQDKRLIERMMEIYRSVGQGDRAELLTEVRVDGKSCEEIKYIFDRTVNVLMIEDDEDDYIITRDMLKEIADVRFDLKWASTYTAGIEFICENKFDVCLLDYNLGGRTGLELLREACTRGCVVPVILFTGHSGREVDIEAMRAGAVDYLVKGKVDANSLERAIRYAIERNRLLSALRESYDKIRAQVVQSTALMDTLNENQKKLQALASHDDLTGLFNRRHFMEIMDKAVNSAILEKKSLVLCIGDIDHYKEINDIYGHQVGDEVLISFASIISECMPKETTVGRYGGDEICILMTTIKVDEALELIEKIRKEFSSAIQKDENGKAFAAEASFGIAEFSSKGDQRQLFRLADNALYEAKATGRNRVVVKKL